MQQQSIGRELAEMLGMVSALVVAWGQRRPHCRRGHSGSMHAAVADGSIVAAAGHGHMAAAMHHNNQPVWPHSHDTSRITMRRRRMHIHLFAQSHAFLGK